MAAIGLVDQSHAERLRQRLCRLCDDKRLFDVVLRSLDGEDLQAHWLILASSSEFFASQTYTPIIYTGIKYNILSVLVNYIYSGQINITADTKDQILAGCEHLKLRDMKNLVQQETGTMSAVGKELASSGDKTHTLDGVDRPSSAKKSRLSKTSKSALNVAQLESDVFQSLGMNLFESNVDQTGNASVVSEVVQQRLSDSSDFGGPIIIKQELDLADDGNGMENESLLEMSTPAPSTSGTLRRVDVGQSNSRVRSCRPSMKTILKPGDDDDDEDDGDYGEVDDDDDDDETYCSQKIPAHGKLRNYQPGLILQAYNEVKNNNVTIAEAARKYGIPYSTLRSRVTGEISLSVLGLGAMPVFTEEQEVTLLNTLMTFVDRGYSYSQPDITEFASDYAFSVGKRKKGDPFSRKWIRGFLKRWPEIKDWKLWRHPAWPTRMMVDSYFDSLHSMLTEHGLLDKPERIYSVCEKCLMIDSQVQYVLEVDSNQIQMTSSESKSSTITVMCCGNAAGMQVPPYFIFPENIRASVMSGATPGTDASVSGTGHSNPATFSDYIQKHFIKHIPAHSKEKPILLLFESNRFPFSIPLMKWTKGEGIIMCFLPAHTGHSLQPLNVGCLSEFQELYERSYMTEQTQTQTQTQTPTQDNVLQFACTAYAASVTPPNLQTGFQKAGVCPFDRGAVDMKKVLCATNKGQSSCGGRGNKKSRS